MGNRCYQSGFRIQPVDPSHIGFAPLNQQSADSGQQFITGLDMNNSLVDLAQNFIKTVCPQDLLLSGMFVEGDFDDGLQFAIFKWLDDETKRLRQLCFVDGLVSREGSQKNHWNLEPLSDDIRCCYPVVI